MKPFQLGEVFEYLRSHKLGLRDMRKALRLAPPSDRLAVAADREGMEPEGVRKFPDILETYGLKGVDISDLMCREARKANADQFAKLLAKMPRPKAPRIADESEGPSKAKSSAGSDPERSGGDPAGSKKGSGKKEAPKKEPAPPKITLFGHPPTSVIRWLGANGYPLSAAEALVDAYELPISKSTIPTQWRAGIKGERGDPAPLTKDQVAEMLKTCKIRKV